MADHRLRINWTIPAPVIIAIIAQAALIAFAIATWKASIEGTVELYRQESNQRSALLESRLTIVERSASNNLALIERVKGVEVNVEVLKGQNQNIESKIDKLIDRAGRR